jgi:hypothetical protein
MDLPIFCQWKFASRGFAGSESIHGKFIDKARQSIHPKRDLSLQVLRHRAESLWMNLLQRLPAIDGVGFTFR